MMIDSTRWRKRPPTQELRRIIRAGLKAGKSYRTMAKELGCQPITFGRWAKSAGFVRGVREV